MTNTESDPRPQLADSLDQLQALIDAVGADDLDRPTPCSDYDVQNLLAHILAVIRKLAVVAHGGNAMEVIDPATDVPDDWAAEIHRARAESDQLWMDDKLLGRDCTLPWGTMTGREFIDAYAHEFTVHAWDLARTFEQVDNLDPQLAEVALDWYARHLPAEARGEGVPFGAVMPVADDADVYTRLAAFVGRKV